MAEQDRAAIALDHAERERLARDLGNHHSMILRNHGLLTVGRDVPEAAVDHGFMYQHGFEDPDGHLWEVMAMDADALSAA